MTPGHGPAGRGAGTRGHGYKAPLRARPHTVGAQQGFLEVWQGAHPVPWLQGCGGYRRRRPREFSRIVPLGGPPSPPTPPSPRRDAGPRLALITAGGEGGPQDPGSKAAPDGCSQAAQDAKTAERSLETPPVKRLDSRVGLTQRQKHAHPCPRPSPRPRWAITPNTSCVVAPCPCLRAEFHSVRDNQKNSFS